MISFLEPLTKYDNHDNSHQNGVFNLSNIPLDSEIINLLSFGGKFIPQNSKSLIKIKESLMSSLLDFCWRLDSSYTLYNKLPYHNSTSSFVKAIPKIKYEPCYDISSSPICLQNYFKEKRDVINAAKFKSSLTNMEKIILNKLKGLKDNLNIIIKPADKNLGICILSKEDYVNRCKKILSDLSTYEGLNVNFKTIAQNSYSELRKILHANGLLFQYNSKTSFTYLARSLLQLEYSCHLQPANFYILPKVHKATLGARPIVSAINTITYHTSRFLHNLLYPYVKKLPTICFSSQSLLPILNKSFSSLNSDSVILCADVTSLYPSIKHDFGISAVEQVLVDFGASTHTVTLISQLLKWVLTNNYLTYNNELYRQIDGTAMGTPVAVCYANIVLYYMERNLVDDFLIYHRYIDDIFAVCNNKEQAELFVERFNKLNNNILLESVTIDRRGIFLDLEIFLLDNNNIHYTLYQKPMNKYQYIPLLSAHPRHMINNFIRNELKRYRNYCKEDEDYRNMVKLFYSRLLARGYTKSFLTPLFSNLPWSNNFMINLNNKSSSKQKLKKNIEVKLQPIVVVNLPSKLNSSVTIREIFDLSHEIINDEIFSKLIASPEVIISRRLGRNIQKTFLHKPLS